MTLPRPGYDFHTHTLCIEPLLDITALEGYYKITSALNMRKMNWEFSGDTFGYKECCGYRRKFPSAKFTAIPTE
jgi:hypothetical protein